MLKFLDDNVDMRSLAEKVDPDQHMDFIGKLKALADLCCMCNQARTIHYLKDIEVDHPFFNNNLEYLEWKSK